MKIHNNNIRIGLRRDRRSRGVVVRPDGTRVIYNGRMGTNGSQDVTDAAGAEQFVPVRKKVRTLSRKRAAGIAASYVAMAVILTGGALVYKNSPAVLAVDGQEICYFRHMDEAAEAIKLAAEDYVPDGGEIEAIDVGDTVTVRKSLGLRHEFKTPREAEELIKSSLIDSGKLQLTTASTAVTYENFTPETDFRQDNDMLAGQERVESEAVEGENRIITRSTVTNGEISQEDVLEVETVKEGSPAVIYRGTIGLPEGEDWKTYDGMPVYNNGDELITDAKHYLGLKYVWGGFDLNKGVDCVGFVCEMYEKFGIRLPHSHTGLRKVGISVPLSEARAGDIICYNGHVALYMGDGRIIHATRGKSNNVHISKSVNYNKKRHIITIRRVVGN